jgi:hypothetical protein
MPPVDNLVSEFDQRPNFLLYLQNWNGVVSEEGLQVGLKNTPIKLPEFLCHYLLSLPCVRHDVLWQEADLSC